jgi:hypothetical protein
MNKQFAFYGVTGVNALLEHDRWPGVTAVLPISKIRQLVEQSPDTPISDIRHPEYQVNEQNWAKWSLVYESGDTFIEEYTEKFSRRESSDDFIKRKRVTPVPAFAKAAIEEVKNSIFQRMADVARVGGSPTYQAACRGQLGGVDRRGASMTWFLGNQVLPELLIKKKVGVWVDNEIMGPSLADRGKKHPYLYRYKAEDILSWQEAPSATGKVFTELLLREWEYTYYNEFKLPAGSREIFRHVYLSNGKVTMDFYDENGNPTKAQIILELTEIPFVVYEISDSLLKDVANHQIALLNLESSDMSYALLGNVPLYTEQYNPASDNPYIKKAQEESFDDEMNGQAQLPLGQTAPCEPEPKKQASMESGSVQGRRYPIGTERPAFISPPTDPLKASMLKQDNLKTDIRSLVHLALSNLQPRVASAESKKMDQSGLESGLSYIGLELEHGDAQIAYHWSKYENTEEIPQITYPKLWSLKTDDERGKEVEQLESLRDSVPSITFQKTITKQMVFALVGTKITQSELDKIYKEIDQAKTITSDPEVLIQDFEAGLISGATASSGRGYSEAEFEQAKKDHADRAANIIAAQTKKDAGAAGVPELSSVPNSGSLEKVGLPKRGAAQS